MPSQPDQKSRKILIAIILAGVVLRLALAAISLGTNDVLNFGEIATHVNQVGLIETYRTDPLLNHPPLPVLWRQLAWQLHSQYWFAFLTKLPAIAADAGSCWLLAKILKDHRVQAVAAMAFSPIAILISGYHCNTDNIYAFFSLLSMYFIASDLRFFLAGLALAAAINIKLIPLLLIPIAFSFCRNKRDAGRLLAGLAIGVIPFLPLLAAADAIVNNMLNYSSWVSEWGIPLFLHDIFKHPPFAQTAHTLMQAYLTAGKMAIIAAILLMSLISWLWRLWTPYQLATLAYATFLVLTPGFGPQYLVMIVPLLLTVDIARSWMFGIFAGMFLLLAYWSRLVSYEIPLRTLFPPDSPTPPGSPFGLIAWFVLLEMIVSLIRPPTKSASR
ncbi:MAG TPA: hypothetical protein VKK61_07105 [Tepidisphaeraceae bacterium]|nr:hypothetical protein [Tepidisphaeraceae bacterium]